MRVIIGIVAAIALAAGGVLLFIGTTAVVESTRGSEGLEGDLLIGMNLEDEMVAVGDADCGNAFADGPHVADLAVEDQCAAAKRPKVIIGWSLAGLGIAGLLGAARWPHRQDPLLAVWAEEP